MYLLTGENTYQARQKLLQISSKFDGQIETFDGASLSENQLADILSAGQLFSDKRLVIIDNLSTNKPLWSRLGDWLGRLNEDITLVLRENHADKRTKTYKLLAKKFKIIECAQWTMRDKRLAEQWASDYARSVYADISPKLIENLVQRAVRVDGHSGQAVIDQQLLATTIETLSLLDKVGDDDVSTVLPPATSENVFELLAVALDGDALHSQQMLGNLSHTEDAYKIIGLLASQWSQLVALKLTDHSPSDVAADIGAHPFVVQKLAAYRSKITLAQLREITTKFAELDEKLKTTGLEPWLAIERLLIAIATR